MAQNTLLPGKIVSYDGRTATVRPAMPMQLASGDVLAPPQIVSVPVCWPVSDGGKAQITVPLRPGDDCLLLFSQRSLENWLSGSDQAPDDPRQYDLTDCLCLPIMRPTVTRADPDAVTVQYGSGSLKIDAGGNVTIKTPKLSVQAPTSTFSGNVSIAGNTTIGGEMTTGGIPFSTHRHTDVENGPGTSGGPV